MRKVSVPVGAGYDILIGAGLLGQAGKLIAERFTPSRVAIITDSTVDKLYAHRLLSSLQEAGLCPCKYVFPAGERSKNLGVYGEILEFLASHELDRSSLIIALGGGVAGDMAGFAAATYMRGIPYVQIPTTLLAAIDSSVGGKTAVDLQSGKNLAGAFHQPSLVLCDTDVLETLPAQIFADGAAEAIKYGVLDSRALFSQICSGKIQEDREEIIQKCVSIKRDYVVQDERDTGARQFLNLGHTIGHAIEACSFFSISHGHAVAMGMVRMARGAYRAGLLEEDCSGELAQAAAVFGMDTRCPYAPDALISAASRDKKRGRAFITLVLPEQIGKCRLQKVPMETLFQIIRLGE